jgi:hypothetical protein
MLSKKTMSPIEAAKEEESAKRSNNAKRIWGRKMRLKPYKSFIYLHMWPT